jgi:hypothetical protein
MSPEIIEKLALEIVSQSFLGNWLFYFLLISLSVVASALSAFGTSYFSTRGANRANKADIEEIKHTLRETTEIAERIKVDLSHVSTRKHAIEQLKREKLELYLLSVIRGSEQLSEEAKHHFFGSPLTSQERHTDVASMIQRLYFPELGPVHAVYLAAIGKFRRWIGDGMQAMLDLRSPENPKPKVPDSHLDQYSSIMKEVNAALLAIEAASKSVAERLNSD